MLLNSLQTLKDLYDTVQYSCCVPDATLFVFRKPYTKVDSNQQQDCPSAVNETLLSVRTPGDVPQVSIIVYTDVCIVFWDHYHIKMV